jgi:hypothetical protein
MMAEVRDPLVSILAPVIYDLATGNYRVQTQADIPSALKALEGRPLYAEKWANFRMVGTKFFILGWKLLTRIGTSCYCC